jgi:cysteine desulfurase/selenocysteine lyase
MVHSASFEKTFYAQMPRLLEAGTPHVAGVIGLGNALEYRKNMIDEIWLLTHETRLCRMLYDALSTLPHVQIMSPLADQPCHLVSFVINNMHAHDAATALDYYNIAVRAGNHCAQPLHTLLGHPATIRASVYAYTTEEDIARCIAAVKAICL